MEEKEPEEPDDKIREIIPWARTNALKEIMEEREKQKREVLLMAKRFNSPLFSEELGVAKKDRD
ncbi:hypothetical protein [Thermococcus sp.]